MTLKEAIVRAVPGIDNQPCEHRLMADENGCPCGEHYRPITLADVLRAIGEVTSLDATIYGAELIMTTLVCEEGRWDLTKDIDGQSPETIAFLESILCK